MQKKEQKSQLLIYKDKKGNIEFRADVSNETIWATQAQIVDLFDIDQSVVSRHIKNVFKDKEVDEKSNMQKMHIANSDKPVNFYSLDVILAVGYKTNSKTAIEFRKWATKTLRSYLTDGFAINRKVIASNYEQFLKVVEDIKNLIPTSNTLDTGDIVELISLIEEKAAPHLLYFMIKNHPFIDGNKRSGAFVFIWFLKQAKILDVSKITPSCTYGFDNPCCR